MAPVTLHVPLCTGRVEVPRNAGQAGIPMFAITTLSAGRGGAEPAPGSLSLQLTDGDVLPHLPASIREYSQRSLHPPPREGCDAQVMAGDKQRLAIV